MNLLVKDNRDYLPKDTKALLEHKEKFSKYRLRLLSGILIAVSIAFVLVLSPQLVKRITTPIYGNNAPDPIITQGFQIKVIQGKDVKTVLAQNNIVSSDIASAPQLGELIVKPEVQEQKVATADSRILTLHNFLVKEGSPMAGSAATFVEVADKYGIDWRLLPSIAGCESGFGRIIPITASGAPSYNAFGFGVYGGTFITFGSWDNAIEIIAKSLVETYGKQNLKPYIMEQSYTPPSYYSDHHWRNTVTEFMNEL